MSGWALPATLPWLLAAAVIEEVVFRGALHEALLRWKAVPRALPNPLVALVFALAHALHRALWLGLAVFPFALLLGWVYERWRTLWPCVLLHAAFNTVYAFWAERLLSALR
jgi:membrane protease YdiL (CAAX protease family)